MRTRQSTSTSGPPGLATAATVRLLAGIAAASLLVASCTADGAGSSGESSPSEVIDQALGNVAAAGGYRYQATGSRHEPGQGRRLGEVVDVSTFDLDFSVDLATESLRLEWRRTMGEQTVVPGAPLDYIEVVAGSGGYIDGDDGVFGIGPSRPMNSSRLAAVQRQQRTLQPHLAIAAALNDGRTLALVEPNVVEVADSPHPTRLAFHEETGDLTELATIESDPLLGDIELTASFSDWQQVGELRIARGVELRVDGVAVHRERRSHIEIVSEPDPATYDLVETVPIDEATYRQGWTNSQWFNRGLALPFGSGFVDQTLDAPVQVVPIAPDVVVVAGTRHNTVLVGASEAVVVIEPSINSDRSRQILDVASAEFPGRPVSHVVLTHDHHDQIGGVRGAVAEGAAVVVPAGDEGFVRDVLTTERSIEPDPLSGIETEVTIETVDGDGSTIAGGAVAAYRFESIHDEHMLLVCIPHAGLAFNSDLFNPGFGEPDAPLPEPQRTFAGELLDAIAANCPSTTGVLGSHGMPTSAPIEVLAANAGVEPLPANAGIGDDRASGGVG